MTAKQLKGFFRIFERAPTRCQAENYPTLSLTLTLYPWMITKLFEKRTALERTYVLGVACKTELNVLDKYYTMATNQEINHSSTATICNPRLNIKIFDRLCLVAI